MISSALGAAGSPRIDGALPVETPETRRFRHATIEGIDGSRERDRCLSVGNDLIWVIRVLYGDILRADKMFG